MLTERSEDRFGFGIGFLGLGYYCHLFSCVRFVCYGEDGLDNPALVKADFVCF